MKKNLKFLSAALICGTMLVSGCSNGVKGKPFEFAADYVKTPAPAEFSITQGDGAHGNVVDVKIESGDTFAVISVEGYGDITVKLFPELAPYAVQNFIELAQSGNYDNRTFHRVIDDFMIQGNGATGNDSNGGSFRNEINTDLRHFYGALSCASALGSNSDQFYIVNSSKPQDNPFMDYFNVASTCSNSVTKCDEYLNSGEYDDNPNAIAYYESNKKFYSESVDGLEAMIQTLSDDINQKYQKGGVPTLDGCYTVFGQTVDGFDVIDKISKVETVVNMNGEKSQPKTEIKIKTVKIYTAD